MPLRGSGTTQHLNEYDGQSTGSRNTLPGPQTQPIRSAKYQYQTRPVNPCQHWHASSSSLVTPSGAYTTTSYRASAPLKPSACPPPFPSAFFAPC